jgi:hypothetical protein
MEKTKFNWPLGQSSRTIKLRGCNQATDGGEPLEMRVADLLEVIERDMRVEIAGKPYCSA